MQESIIIRILSAFKIHHPYWLTKDENAKEHPDEQSQVDWTLPVDEKDND